MRPYPEYVRDEAEWQRRRYFELLEAHPDVPGDVLAGVAKEDAEGRALTRWIADLTAVRETF